MGPVLVISPEIAEHPIPGKGSFQSALRLLDFFQELNELKIRRLDVYLSGGASSLAWLKPASVSRRELNQKLKTFYRKPWTIQRLNHERSKLCRLKAGGAYRFLREISPQTRVQVLVTSDVAPYDPELVGSGPFQGAAHRVLADNRKFVTAVRKILNQTGERVLHHENSKLGMEAQWAREIIRQVRSLQQHGKTGVLVLGGEPQVDLSGVSRKSRGGRQSQLAARLALEFWAELREGSLEVLCASSDGCDGNSGAAAVDLSFRKKREIQVLSSQLRRNLQSAIRMKNTAPFLAEQGFLIPQFSTGTNVQDLVMIRLSAKGVSN